MFDLIMIASIIVLTVSMLGLAYWSERVIRQKSGDRR